MLSIVLRFVVFTILNSKNTFGIEAKIESELPEHLFFFSESQSRFIVTTDKKNKDKLEKLFQEQNVTISPLGKVGGINFSLNGKINTKVQDLVKMYYQTLPGIMDQ